MNNRQKIALVVIVAIFVSFGAVAYGASTAPKPVVTQATNQTISKDELASELKAEQLTITGVLEANYPTIKTNYLINQGQLFDQGQWYATTLTYKGSDSMNRDTLRVLMQKKQGIWTLRTTPPQLLLSTVEFPDVPKNILDTVNKAISLPGDDTSSPTSTSISANG